MKHPLAFLEIWAIKINPVMLKPSSNVVALPDFSDLRALKAQGLLWPRALQGVKHLNRVIPPFQSHGSGMGGISKHPSLADRSVLSYTITSVKCNKHCRQEGIVWFVWQHCWKDASQLLRGTERSCMPQLRPGSGLEKVF